MKVYVLCEDNQVVGVFQSKQIAEELSSRINRTTFKDEKDSGFPTGVVEIELNSLKDALVEIQEKENRK